MSLLQWRRFSFAILHERLPRADRVCVRHRDNPPRTATGQELQQWMCEVHNSVNEQLHKPLFNCKAMGLRWGSLDCEETACSMEGFSSRNSA